MNIVFEWHPAKEASNLRKHGVAFVEAASVFADPLARIFDDPDRSEAEEREVIVGHSAAQRLLVVSFTARRDSIRMISARKATRRERRDYEESIIP